VCDRGLSRAYAGFFWKNFYRLLFTPPLSSRHPILQPNGQQSQVRVAWWQEQRNEVVDGFLVESQNQGRVGTTLEPSHEWRLTEATPSSWGLQWFSRKPLGYSFETQNRGRNLDEEVRPPRPVQPPESQLRRSFEVEVTRRDRKACVEAKQGCGHWASIRWRKSNDFQILP
jgi:hypothetical protein